MKKFIHEFKEFALKGNVMNLAVGVIIGAAFQSIVTALTSSFINPLIAVVTGGTNGAGDTTITKTHGRKSVGGINRMVMDAQYFGKKLEKEAKYQWELSEYLNRDICQPEGFDAYGYPSELFKLDMERLGIATKRKPAKVIDIAQYIENNRGTND